MLHLMFELMHYKLTAQPSTSNKTWIWDKRASLNDFITYLWFMNKHTTRFINKHTTKFMDRHNWMHFCLKKICKRSLNFAIWTKKAHHTEWRHLLRFLNQNLWSGNLWHTLPKPNWNMLRVQSSLTLDFAISPETILIGRWDLSLWASSECDSWEAEVKV